MLRRLHENNRVLDLTDGGHFENLGLYELARRRLKTIIVCDGSADPQSQFGALALAIERIKVDFGATIEFEKRSDEVNTSAGKNSAPMRFQEEVAKYGFAIGKITYKCGNIGTIIYIKPALISKLGPEVDAYVMKNPIFPHESTADQFFDEVQFEAYRELGFRIGCVAAPSITSALNNTN